MKKWKKWKNWLSAAVLAAVFGVGLLTAQTETLKAEPAPYDRRGHISPDERLNLSRARAGKADPKAWRRINGICYNGSGKPISGAVTRGIDVSEWQGRIDWQKVKNSDVDFAFIRISHGLRHMDETFDYNMEQAELAGLPAGAYIYSEATTTTTALKEAQLAIQKLKGYKVSYPVVFDLEDAATMGKLSPTEVSKVALTFCDEIRKAGYVPMLYMNLNWYNNKVDWNLLKDSGLDVWAASYGDTINAPDRSRYTYGIWQCTDGNEEVGLNTTKKLVDGIPPENNVDMNFGFVDYTTKVVPRWEPKADYVPSAKPLYPDTTVTVKNGLVTEGGRLTITAMATCSPDGKKSKGNITFSTGRTVICARVRLFTTKEAFTAWTEGACGLPEKSLP